MKTVLAPMEALADFVNLRDELRIHPGMYDMSGCIDAAKPQMIYGIGHDARVKLVVVSDERKAKNLAEELGWFEDKVLYYPAKDFLFYQSDIRGNALTRERMQVVEALQSDEPMTIVCTMAGLMNRLPELSVYSSNVLHVKTEEDITVKEWRLQLAGLGYDLVGQVEHPGEFAVRGGIIDIFPLTEEFPVRIELWGDMVDTIKYFDPESQISLHDTALPEEIDIYPAAEMVLTPQQIEAGISAMEADAKKLYESYRKEFKTEEAARIKNTTDQLIEQMKEGWISQDIETHLTYFCEKTVSLLDYAGKDALVILDETRRLHEAADGASLEFTESMKHRLEAGYILPGQMNMLYLPEEIWAKLSMHKGVVFSALDVREKSLDIKGHFHVHAVQGNVYNSSMEQLRKDLLRHKKNGMKVMYVGSSRTRATRLAEDLLEDGISAFYTEDMDHTIERGQMLLTVGNIRNGYELPDAGFILITETDVFGTRAVHKKKRKKQYDGESISAFSDLKVGDYVVHENHGLGIYRGIEKIEVDHIMKDYIKIEYAKGGNLYILASQLDMLQKYASSDAKKPKLNSLGSGSLEWKNTKSKVKTAVETVAKELVDLYAVRQQDNGYVYGKDTVWQKEFEETFPYEETQGQLDAVDAIKEDMESPKIMDRLICGDVGYGKTEIAMRAAFKAVQENKQVVYLCPTTILAQQQYNNFVQRMANYPVNIGLLCRYRTSAQMKETIKGVKNGLVDIVIGTHRVLSKDVEFKDLGLLIIDEEQRFGVNHKEKIKQMRKNVDVISLSATPIPRTLHMSLVGIRDMSVLEEAPMERTPIQTFVFEYNEEMVREAILREMARGGQVYYVFNRVAQIAEVTARLSELVPEANIAFAHGKMSQTQMESIMYDFINGEIDVLVSTTIIEIGLDISNVNTIIIHDAENLGLSQLYQLRGRVGRSSRTAYAFFMYRKDKMLKEVAEKRLAAIKEFSDLGSGVKIAMRDLEIRGAGNMLGEAQHGHMAAVGYDLYCKMLNEAVRQEKGEEVLADFETSVDLSQDAYIPSNYVSDEEQRLDLYKRIAQIQTEEERDEMLEELIDRFGEPSRAVQNLLWIAMLKAEAHRAWITDIKQTGMSIRIMAYETANINPAVIPELISRYSPYLSLIPNAEAPGFLLDFGKNSKVSAKEIPDQLRRFILDLYELAVEH